MKKLLVVLLLPLWLLADSINGWTPLHQAIYDGNTKNIDKQSTKYNIEKASKAGIRPLHLAVKMRQLDTVEKLLNKGADIDAQDNNGQTPLHYAIGQNQTKIAKLLIAKEADMDIKNKYGITPLHQAAFKGDTDIIQYMIDNGATVDVKNKQGVTPCQLAFAKQNIGATSLLQHYSKIQCGIKVLPK
ncbi:MAG: ankyrin repeat domain-containing protein [Sulfurovaceae bacterium]|nr:ankyrin repeat domain-containing protein [Sulfurovaceae bacterium]